MMQPPSTDFASTSVRAGNRCRDSGLGIGLGLGGGSGTPGRFRCICGRARNQDEDGRLRGRRFTPSPSPTWFSLTGEEAVRDRTRTGACESDEPARLPQARSTRCGTILNPIMDAQRRLLARWSCSTMLLRYLQVRTPERMLSAQSPQGAPTRHVAVEGNFARTARMRSECLPEKRLCRGDAAVRSQQEVNGPALLVDGAVQVVPTTTNRDIGLVHTPRSADGSSEKVPSLFELGHVSDHT